MASSNKKKVAYFYDEEIGKYSFGGGHPMKPYRLNLTHSLVHSFGLFKKMQVYRAEKATEHDMYQFHSKEYVDFLKMVNPETKEDYESQLEKFRLNSDNPVCEGIWDYCARITGASLQAADLLNQTEHDIVINWSGGFHHAKRESASGFCYINDIVLSIISLLNHHTRVLYIDIDVHHGDAVQEAFYKTDRVMTLSFHEREDEFFPKTGNIDEFGVNAGRYYSINVPLRKGCTDAMYEYIFKEVVKNVMDFYRPDAIVLQCGADSLAGDILGEFNLSVHGHGKCVKFVKSFNIPMLVLGGGGYTPYNVARCWTYDTSVCLDVDLPDKTLWGLTTPENSVKDFTLTLNYDIFDEKKNFNTYKSLDEMIKLIKDLLKQIAHAPSVQMKEICGPIVPDGDEENIEPDVRDGERQHEKCVAHEAEFYDDEDDYDSEVCTSPNDEMKSLPPSMREDSESDDSNHASMGTPPHCKNYLVMIKPVYSKDLGYPAKQNDDSEQRENEKSIKKLNSARYKMHLKIKAALAKQVEDNNLSDHSDVSYVSSSEDEDASSCGDELSESDISSEDESCEVSSASRSESEEESGDGDESRNEIEDLGYNKLDGIHVQRRDALDDSIRAEVVLELALSPSTMVQSPSMEDLETVDADIDAILNE